MSAQLLSQLYDVLESFRLGLVYVALRGREHGNVGGYRSSGRGLCCEDGRRVVDDDGSIESKSLQSSCSKRRCLSDSRGRRSRGPRRLCGALLLPRLRPLLSASNAYACVVLLRADALRSNRLAILHVAQHDWNVPVDLLLVLFPVRFARPFRGALLRACVARRRRNIMRYSLKRLKKQFRTRGATMHLVRYGSYVPSLCADRSHRRWLPTTNPRPVHNTQSASENVSTDCNRNTLRKRPLQKQTELLGVKSMGSQSTTQSAVELVRSQFVPLFVQW